MIYNLCIHTVSTARSGVAITTPKPHAMIPINTWKVMMAAGASFTILCCMSGVMNSHSIFWMTTYSMTTHNASSGETVNATSAAGIMEMSGQKVGMKLRSHASNAKTRAYGTHMIHSPTHVATNTMSIAAICPVIHLPSVSYDSVKSLLHLSLLVSGTIFNTIFLYISGVAVKYMETIRII